MPPARTASPACVPEPAAESVTWLIDVAAAVRLATAAVRQPVVPYSKDGLSHQFRSRVKKSLSLRTVRLSEPCASLVVSPLRPREMRTTIGEGIVSTAANVENEPVLAQSTRTDVLGMAIGQAPSGATETSGPTTAAA